MVLLCRYFTIYDGIVTETSEPFEWCVVYAVFVWRLYEHVVSNLINSFGEIHHNHVCLSSIVHWRKEIMRELGELSLARPSSSEPVLVVHQDCLII